MLSKQLEQIYTSLYKNLLFGTKTVTVGNYHSKRCRYNRSSLYFYDGLAEETNFLWLGQTGNSPFGDVNGEVQWIEFSSSISPILLLSMNQLQIRIRPEPTLTHSFSVFVGGNRRSEAEAPKKVNIAETDLLG